MKNNLTIFVMNTVLWLSIVGAIMATVVFTGSQAMEKAYAISNEVAAQYATIEAVGEEAFN